jgi:hypothetical protein
MKIHKLQTKKVLYHWALVLQANFRQSMKGVPRTNTSILPTFVNYDRKKFYKNGPRTYGLVSSKVWYLLRWRISGPCCPLRRRPRLWLSTSRFGCRLSKSGESLAELKESEQKLNSGLRLTFIHLKVEP